jgi:predicted DNA-binding transcriptional regulator YafY
LSKRLEVSVRTIYRDVDALSIAGVPIYAERGRGGGIALLDRYRTTLTGLKDDEIRALFAASVAGPLADLGLADDLRSAVEKLSASLPSPRGPGTPTVQRVHLDPATWSPAPAPPPHLATLYRALTADRCVHLRYRLIFDAQRERTVGPLGLVAKASRWYFICQVEASPRVIPVSDISAARMTDAEYRYPDRFDLAAFWTGWVRTAAAVRPQFSATVRISADLLDELVQWGAEGYEIIEPPSCQGGAATIVLYAQTFHSARQRILGWGGAAEVLAPEPLRESVLDFAHRIVAAYVRTPAVPD